MDNDMDIDPSHIEDSTGSGPVDEVATSTYPGLQILDSI
jgi:hypothetical protein